MRAILSRDTSTVKENLSTLMYACFQFREDSIRLSGKREKCSKASTSSTIILPLKRITGNIASTMIGDSINSTCMASNLQGPHNKLDRTNRITFPQGTYDTGDGYYEPVKSIIYTFDGQILRTPTEEEVKFILAKCRYVPKAIDIDGNTRTW